ncbi:MAG: hypothetical protein AAB225_29800, partial [Acidobacteriota bacterium]
TFIRTTGEVNPTIDWRSTVPGMPAWQNGFRDRSYFRDPLRGRGQPPPPTGLLDSGTDFPILNGNIVGSSDPNNPRVLPSGYYYAAEMRDGSLAATGGKLTISGYVRFSAVDTGGIPTIPSTTPPAAWGDWVMFGGVNFQTNANAKFDPGRYIMAGVKHVQQNKAPEVFSFANQVILEDHTPLSALGVSQPNKPGDAGELFIFTDANYVGWNPLTESYVPLEIPQRVRAIKSELGFGVANMQAGANSTTYINLHALNNDPADTVGSGNVPLELRAFRPVIFWQDQGNSRVLYTGDPEADPTFDVDYRASTCETGIDGLTSPNINNPCPQTTPHPETPEMRLQATPNTHLFGAVYQPRGAWLVLQGSGGMASPLQVVSGSLAVQGGPTVTLMALDRGLERRMVALVE